MRSQSILQPKLLWLVSARLDRGLGVGPQMLGDICSSEGVAVRHSPLIIEYQVRHTGIVGDSPTSIDSQATIVLTRLCLLTGGVLAMWLVNRKPPRSRC